MYEVVVVVAVVLLIIPYIIIIIKKNSKSFVVRPNKNVRIAKHFGNASDTTKKIDTKGNTASCRLMCNAVSWRQNAVEVK